MGKCIIRVHRNYLKSNALKLTKRLCDFCGAMLICWFVDTFRNFDGAETFWIVRKHLLLLSWPGGCFNTLRASDEYMRQGAWSSLVRWWLVAKSALSHCLNQCCHIVNWTLRNKLGWIFLIEIQTFSSRKQVWKCCMQDGGHFVLASLCQSSSVTAKSESSWCGDLIAHQLSVLGDPIAPHICC